MGRIGPLCSTVLRAENPSSLTCCSKVFPSHCLEGENPMSHRELPIPAHFDADKVAQVWRVPYQDRAREAQAWPKQHDIKPAAGDKVRMCLMAIDVQNTFCLPDFELFVGGRSGRGAIE